MLDFGTFIKMLAAKKAAEAQEEGIEDWQEKLNQLVAEYQAGFDPIWTFVDPLADPALAGITNDILLSLGQPSGGAGLRGGPMDQVISLAGARGGDIAKVLGGAMRRYKKTGQARYPGADDEEAEHIARAVREAGYTNIKDFFAAQATWEEEQARFEAESEPYRQAIREGRFAGYEKLATMLKEYPTPMAERGVQEEALYAEIDRQRQLEEAAIIQSAQAYGYNPAGAMGQLAERTTLQREQASANAITRALQMLEGYNQGITGLQSGLLPQQEMGLNLAGLRSQGLSSMGQLAAQQASVVNQLQTQRDTTALLAQIGFPAEYLQGINQAGMYGSWGATMGDALDLYKTAMQVMNVVSSIYGAKSGGMMGGAGGGGSGAGAEPAAYTPSTTTLPTNTWGQGPAVSGRGWTYDWAGMGGR